MGINGLTRIKKELKGHFQNKPQFSFIFISRSHHTYKLCLLCNDTYVHFHSGNVGIHGLTRTKKELNGHFQNKPQFSFNFISRSHHTSKLFSLWNTTYIFLFGGGDEMWA